MCRCWLLGRARATQAKKCEIQANTLTKKRSIVGLAVFGSRFQPLALEYLKKHQKSLPEPFPRPPGDLLAGPRRPKGAPRLAQEPPSPRSASRAVLAAIWRPRGLQRPPSCYFGLLRARFSTFREAFSLASRRLESIAPEAPKARIFQTHEAANASE